MEAEEVMRKALAIYTKVYGKRHQKVLNGSGNLGRILMDQGKPEGKMMVQQALDGLQGQGLPASHAWIVKFNKALASA